LLHAAALHGLAQQYHERSTQGCHLQGRLDVAAQMRQGPLQRHSIPSLFDEQTVNVPRNQAIRAVAETLLAHANLSPAAHQMLHESLRGWQGVTPQGPDLDLLHRAAHSAAELDRPLLGLCLLLAQSQTPSLDAGATPSPGYLLDMERVFERYLTTGLEQQFTGWGWQVQRQPTLPVSVPNSRQPGVLIRPDLLVLRQEEPILVVDAKWKRLKNHQPRTEDLYQALAYCLALDCRNAALVYPGKKSVCQEIRLQQPGTRLRVDTLNVSRSGEAGRQELRRLGKQLQTLAVSQR
jgi:5-methylcytosine-specific restriction endonuclease McrBC regulatory subunit McrC